MFTKQLRDLRTSKKLTQQQLASAIGVSTSAIGMYEQGRREPDIQTLCAFADFFQVSVDYLLGRLSSFTFQPKMNEAADIKFVINNMKKILDKYSSSLLPNEKSEEKEVLNRIIVFIEHEILQAEERNVNNPHLKIRA